MDKYNPKYYSDNRQPLIKRNTQRKKDLRERKKQFILNRHDNECPHCLTLPVHPIKIYIEYSMDDAPTKSIFDLPWFQIELLLNNDCIEVICSTCKYRGKPADHVGS